MFAVGNGNVGRQGARNSGGLATCHLRLRGMLHLTYHFGVSRNFMATRPRRGPGLLRVVRFEPGLPGTIHNLSKFLLASVRRRLRNFLKNTGKFQVRPLGVLKSFSKIWEVSGRFGRSLWLIFEIQVSAVHMCSRRLL